MIKEKVHFKFGILEMYLLFLVVGSTPVRSTFFCCSPKRESYLISNLYKKIPEKATYLSLTLQKLYQYYNQVPDVGRYHRLAEWYPEILQEFQQFVQQSNFFLIS